MGVPFFPSAYFCVLRVIFPPLGVGALCNFRPLSWATPLKKGSPYPNLARSTACTNKCIIWIFYVSLDIYLRDKFFRSSLTTKQNLHEYLEVGEPIPVM